MSPEWNREDIIDWVLTLMAVVVAAGLLAGARSAPPSKHASVSTTRELEFRTQMTTYPDLRTQMGVGEADLLNEVIDELVGSDTTDPQHLIVAGTMAVIAGTEERALEALDELAQQPPEVLDAFRPAAVQLSDLARGRAGPTEALGAVLKDAGGSPWLMLSLESLRAKRHGDTAAAMRIAEEARVEAHAFIGSIRGIGGVGFTLLLLGCLLTVFWPMVRRSLDGAGMHGLGDAPSPFIHVNTHRIMVVWFLGHVVMAGTLSALAIGMGKSAQAQALNVSMQSLLSGGLALWLIQRWGRRDQDMVGLWMPLRIGFSPSTRGLPGLLAWTVGGLSMGLVMVVSGTVVSAVTLGENESTQSALELFSAHSEFEVRAALTLSAVVFAPIFEEIVFRGFLYRNLRDMLGKTPAMLLAGFLFGLVHLDLHLILPLTGLGFVLCLLFERSGTLLAPILVHAAWNLGQLIILTLLVGG